LFLTKKRFNKYFQNLWHKREAVSKCFPLTAGFKIKEDENFNHRNTCSISRIALKVSADASLRVTKVPKFESDADIGQISADFERERFEIGSREEKQCIYKSYNTFG